MRVLKLGYIFATLVLEFTDLSFVMCMNSVAPYFNNKQSGPFSVSKLCVFSFSCLLLSTASFHTSL